MITSLEASTAAIEQQCQLLESQKQALTDLKARNVSRKKNSVAQDRQKKLASEKAQLDFEIDELADALQAKLQASAKQANASVSSMPPSVDRIFEKDDRLLDGLQKLLPKLSDASSDGDGVAEVDRLCEALIALSAQEICLRVDAIYKASAGQPSAQSNGRAAEMEEQNEAARAELAYLANEIDNLAAMAVNGQYRDPLFRELKGSNSDAATNRARWSEYVAATLQYLTTRLVALEEHFQHLQAHQRALSQLTSALETTTAKPAAPQVKQNATRARDRSPATPVAKGLKPLRLVQANLSEPQDPVTQLLRLFDIRVTDTSDTAKLKATLEQASKDRNFRLTQLRESTERMMSDQLAEIIVKADKDVQDLLAAVYAHSPFGTVRLVDAEVENGIARLEATTQGLGEEMRGLDVDALGRKVREKQREILGA